MTAFVYVRKSVMAADDKTLSPAVQEERCIALAAAHGDASPVVLSDLDVSGAKVEERRGYMRLVEAIQSGEATAVYAYDLSRLHRNAGESDRFWKLVAVADVPVFLTDMTVDPRNATGRMVIGMLAQMNAWYSQVTSEKLRATFAMKRKRGDTDMGGRLYGTRPGESVAAVVAAYRSTESFFKAARLLNEAKVPTRNVRSRGWSATAVKSVVRRNAPALLVDVIDQPVRGSRGGQRMERFARVLRCSVCGGMLTPLVDRRTSYVRYYCHNGNQSSHGRATVSEAAVMRAVLPETNRAALFVKRVKTGSEADEATGADLDARRTRIVQNFEDGDITREQKAEKLATIAEAESKLSALRWIRKIALPPDIERDDPAKVNAYLRRLFESVSIDMETAGRPGVTTDVAATFEWRDPSMRWDPEDAESA